MPRRASTPSSMVFAGIEAAVETVGRTIGRTRLPYLRTAAAGWLGSKRRGGPQPSAECGHINISLGAPHERRRPAGAVVGVEFGTGELEESEPRLRKINVFSPIWVYRTFVPEKQPTKAHAPKGHGQVAGGVNPRTGRPAPSARAPQGRQRVPSRVRRCGNLRLGNA
jgi:hypothetical protein